MMKETLKMTVTDNGFILHYARCSIVLGFYDTLQKEICSQGLICVCAEGVGGGVTK